MGGPTGLLPESMPNRSHNLDAAQTPVRRTGAASRGAVARMALLVVAGVVAVVLTALLVLWGSEKPPESKAFTSTPEFVLWLVLLSGQAATWVGAAPFVAATIRRRRRDLLDRGALDNATLLLIAAAVTTLLLFVALAILAGPVGIYESVASAHVPTGDEWPLTHHQQKMFVLVTLGVTIGLAAVAAMWLTSVGFLELARDVRPRAAVVERFIALRTEMTALLAVAGALIGLATLASGALREAVLATNDEPEYTTSCLSSKDELGNAPKCTLEFDAQYVVAYGLLFTGVLALAFVPSFFAMRRAGERLRDRAFPLPRPTSPRFEETVSRRASLDALLETNLSATASFKAGVAIVSPLVASVISTALPG